MWPGQGGATSLGEDQGRRHGGHRWQRPMEKAFEFLILALHGNEVGVLSGPSVSTNSTRLWRASVQTRHSPDCGAAGWTGVDPDEAFSSIPYEKGARFVALIERAVGPERFAQFMQRCMHGLEFSVDYLQKIPAVSRGAAPRRRRAGAGAAVAVCARHATKRARVHLSDTHRADGTSAGMDGRPAPHHRTAPAVGAARSLSVPPAPAAPARPRLTGVAGHAPRPHGPWQLRDPGGVVDDCRRLRLRTGLWAPPRGTDAGRPHEVPAPVVHRARQTCPHAAPRAPRLCCGKRDVSQPVAACHRSHHGAVGIACPLICLGFNAFGMRLPPGFWGHLWATSRCKTLQECADVVEDQNTPPVSPGASGGATGSVLR